MIYRIEVVKFNIWNKYKQYCPHLADGEGYNSMHETQIFFYFGYL